VLAIISRRQVLSVTHFVGVMTAGIAAAMVVPLLTAVSLREWDPALDYGVGVSVALVVALALLAIGAPAARSGVNRAQALMATAGGWLICALVGAAPLALSANYPTYLDAFFDTMSGMTTSGLTVAVDLDHMSYAHNMWRHLTHLIGGQGIIVAALSLAIGSKSGGVALYEAEGREERILPNVIHTARFIWVVTAAWVAMGTAALVATNLWLGQAPVRAVLHAFWMTIAAYDTGGFGPQSSNVLFYHSALVEAVLIVLMLAGMLNFSLQAAVMRGDPRELLRNLETRTLFVNMAALVVVVAASAALAGVLGTPPEVVRKGVYHIVSAHSGTGHQAVYAPQWEATFGSAGFIAIALAMAAGGSVSSTAGGIKAMRLGLLAKTVVVRAREALAPSSALVREKYHHLTNRVVTSQLMSGALVAFALFAIAYVTGGVAGAMFGYPPDAAMFESISATANVGLTTGITSAAMPAALKLVYITLMWAGRLEFIAVLVLVAGIASAIRSRRRRA